MNAFPLIRCLTLIACLGVGWNAAAQDVATPAAPASAKPPDATDRPTGDDAIRLQIFLDESNFGPGVIDGKPGRFTELAVQSWNEIHGHPIRQWGPAMDAARQQVTHATAIALVPECAKDWVDPTLPTEHAEQAKKNRMSYRSYVEFMAERYHTSSDFLRETNGDQVLKDLAPRSTIRVPNVAPFKVEDITGTRYPNDPQLSKRQVVVDTKINQVRIYQPAPAAIVVADPTKLGSTPPANRNPALIASFPITPGETKFIQLGTWELRSMVELPWWRYDQSLLDTGVRGSDANALNIPPGPNSPVGVIWNGTSKPGIGMHGTSDPETIGRARSHGCIRLSNWDAIRLPGIIRPGASVEIR